MSPPLHMPPEDHADTSASRASDNPSAHAPTNAPTNAPGDAPVFLVGCDRSGTTLLRLMLMQAPAFHIVHETGFVPVLADRAEDYGDFSTARQRWFFLRDIQRFPATTKTTGWTPFHADVGRVERALSRGAPLTYADACRLLYETAASAAQVSRWGDKTPAYVHHLPELARMFPTAVFVHIVRDGRDVAQSLVQAGWHATIREAAERWRSSVSAARRAGTTMSAGRYVEISFEDLVEAPELTLRALCRDIGLTYTSAMLEFHRADGDDLPKAHDALYRKTRQPLDPTRAGAWRGKAARTDVADVEQVAGDLLQALEYPLSGYRVAPHRRWARSFIKTVRPVARRLL